RSAAAGDAAAGPQVGNLEPQPGLAHAAGTGDRDAARAVDGDRELLELGLTADEAGVGQARRPVAALGCRGHELGARLGPELATEARDVALDRAHRDEQL